jgi:uncharacterized protein YggE
MRLLPFLFAVALAAQETPPSVPFIRAQGTATATAQPDEARLSVGVTTQAPTAADASTANAKIATAIISAMKAAFPGTAQISTVN